MSRRSNLTNRRSCLKSMGLATMAAAFQDSFAPFGRAQGASQSASALSAALNQVGYLPGNQKIASIPAPSPVPSPVPVSAAKTFRIYHAGTRQIAFEGALPEPALDADSGDRIALADFSALKTPGLYALALPDTDQKQAAQLSRPFSIGERVYREPLRLAMRAFYGQRCGCAVDLGDGYQHPACHRNGAYHATSGRQGSVPNHGGWHDAGDYGRYVVNSGISTATLLWAWELYPNALQPLSLGIPESGGKLPDFLAEIQWNLKWMISLQDEDGGVWQKQTSERFCAFLMPQDDALTSYVIGTGQAPYKSTCATADLAAVMAIAARCYRPFDPAFADVCLAAAKRAWIWAVAHPSIVFRNPPGIATGEYGDADPRDEILWATAELWRTTRDEQYGQAFRASFEALPPESAIQVPGWGNLAPLAYWTWLLAAESTSIHSHSSTSEPASSLRARILAQTEAIAQKLIARHAAGGYGTTLATGDYNWGSNAVAANQSLLLLVAHRLQPNPRAVEAALGNLHYLLGRNCFQVSWVTHVGARPFQHPHHRPSAADRIAAPWPGLLSGGPNAHPGDAIAHALPKQPPMRMWVDDERAYSLNEVAINWNAPLVFLLAAANHLAG